MESMKNELELLKTKEVAALLGVEPTKVYQLIKYENLPNRKTGRAYRFIKSSILNWKEDNDKREADFADSLSIYKVASMLRMSISTVDKLVKNEGLPYHIYKPGIEDKLYFKKEEVIDWFVNGEQNKPAKPKIAELVKQPEPLTKAAVTESVEEQLPEMVDMFEPAESLEEQTAELKPPEPLPNEAVVDSLVA